MVERYWVGTAAGVRRFFIMGHGSARGGRSRYLSPFPRLAGIDCPERKQPWGQRAKQALSELRLLQPLCRQRAAVQRQAQGAWQHQERQQVSRLGLPGGGQLRGALQPHDQALLRRRRIPATGHGATHATETPLPTSHLGVGRHPSGAEPALSEPALRGPLGPWWDTDDFLGLLGARGRVSTPLWSSPIALIQKGDWCGSEPIRRHRRENRRRVRG